MMRWILSGTALLSCTLLPCQAEEFSFYHENVLGTSLELKIDALSATDADQGEKAVLEEIERLDAIFNPYDEDSDLRRFSEAPLDTPQLLPRELAEVMVASDGWQLKTAGAFNPRAAEYTTLWEAHAETNTLPTDEELGAAVTSAQRPAWAISPSLDRAEPLHRGPIDLNAIAKGYIIDQATRAAMAASGGIGGVVGAIGGDLKGAGDIQKKVGIANPWAPADNATPLLEVQLQNQAIATSASYLRGFDIQGTHYSHIIDPRTGRPVAGKVKAASVIANEAATADALATALMVLSVEEGLALVDSLDGVDCLIIGEDQRQHPSAQFGEFLPASPVATPVASTWEEGRELTVDFEINRPDTRAYERPYLGVWLEDSEGHVVKTLCLWVQKRSHFVKTLRRWVHQGGIDWEQIDMISRPTRMPGKYTLTWDGMLDDGQPLPVGDYTLFIEAAREHGSYQLMRQPIVLDGTPQKFILEGNAEIKSALITFGPTPR